MTMTKSSLEHELQRTLNPYLSIEQSDALTQALGEIRASADISNDLLFHSASVKRTFLNDNNRGAIIDAQHTSFSVDMAIRCLFILTALTKTLSQADDSEQHPKITFDLLKYYYQYGDEFEKFVLLRGLPLFDKQGAALQVAVNACRCNNVLEFSEIALNNPYPAQHFPELNFNQMVLKSLFMGLDISKVVNLAERKNPKLSNMCFAYAIEQALAERVPPASLWLAVNLEDLEGDNLDKRDKFLRHFSEVDEAHKTTIELEFGA